MKIFRTKIQEHHKRVKGSIHGVWDKCLDCGADIKVIEGYEGRCVCKECKLGTKEKLNE